MKKSWDYWIGYRFKENCLINEIDEQIDNIKLKYIKPSVYYWYADPMIAIINGEYYVFTEAFHRIKEKGVIAVSKLKRGKLSKPKIVLEEPFHLSFPNVFSYKGKYYMIPESSADNSILIYEMLDSPYEWKLFKRIKTEKSYVDIAVGFDENEEPVLFLSEENEENKLIDKLCVYMFSDFPNGDFLNSEPIYETDFSYCDRNAGTICTIDQKQYRFSQINEPHFYGKSIKIHEIKQMSSSQYTENTVGQITADRFKAPNGFESKGTHTYNSVGSLEVIDFVGNVSSFPIFIFALRNLIRNRVIKRVIFALKGKFV